MTESNLKYIQNVKVEDIPWHRLTTAYKRATDFPKYFDVLFKMKSKEDVKAAVSQKTVYFSILDNLEKISKFWSLNL